MQSLFVQFTNRLSILAPKSPTLNDDEWCTAASFARKCRLQCFRAYRRTILWCFSSKALVSRGGHVKLADTDTVYDKNVPKYSSLWQCIVFWRYLWGSPYKNALNRGTHLDYTDARYVGVRQISCDLLSRAPYQIILINFIFIQCKNRSDRPQEVVVNTQLFDISLQHEHLVSQTTLSLCPRFLLLQRFTSYAFLCHRQHARLCRQAVPSVGDSLCLAEISTSQLRGGRSGERSFNSFYASARPTTYRALRTEPAVDTTSRAHTPSQKTARGRSVFSLG